MRRSTSQWREEARRVIHQVLLESQGLSERDIRLAIRKAYPFGQRRYWPYKVWLSEIKRQRGTPVHDDFASGSLFASESP